MEPNVIVYHTIWAVNIGLRLRVSHGPPFYLGCPKCQGTMVNQSAYCALPFDIKAGPNQAN